MFCCVKVGGEIGLPTSSVTTKLWFFASWNLKPRTEAFCFYNERQMSCYSNYKFKISIEVLTK